MVPLPVLATRAYRAERLATAELCTREIHNHEIDTIAQDVAQLCVMVENAELLLPVSLPIHKNIIALVLHSDISVVLSLSQHL